MSPFAAVPSRAALTRTVGLLEFHYFLPFPVLFLLMNLKMMVVFEQLLLFP